MVDDCVITRLTISPCVGRDADLASSVAAEYIQRFGTLVVWYHVTAVALDPVYREPEQKSDWTSADPIPIKVIFRIEDKELEPDEKGALLRTPGSVVFSVDLLRMLEISYIPTEGDVLHIWDTYFEIGKVQLDGWVNDEQYFSQYVCEVARAFKYTPEQRITVG